MSYLSEGGKYPYITDLINSGGELSIGYTYGLEVLAIANDEGGTIWEGKMKYESLEALLQDAEMGINKWIEENW